MPTQSPAHKDSLSTNTNEIYLTPSSNKIKFQSTLTKKPDENFQEEKL